jgi:hypothetical protein
VLNFRGKLVCLITIFAALGVGLSLFIFSGKKDTSKATANIEDSPEKKNQSETFLSFARRDFSWKLHRTEEGEALPFDLFTCPSVHRENGKIIVKTYETLIVDDAFPLYLAEIKEKPYRIKVEGYSQAKTDKDFIIMFKDVETNKRGECSVDEKCESLNLRVRAFEIQTTEKDGITFETPIVKIYDEALRKEFVLTNEQKFLEGEYIVVIKDMAGNEYALREIGKSIKIKEVTCTLRSFSKKDGMAKLLLKDARGQEFNKTVHLMY